MTEVRRIEAVSVAGPARLRIVWRDKPVVEEIDLSQWIATGGDVLAPLLNADVFSKADVSEHGAAVSWDGGEGALSIDAFHLKKLAKSGRRK